MILLTTGKGGVGKTTIAAATAWAAAAAGRRTVLVSIDPAHSLGDVLDQRLGAEPRSVAPHLDAFEVALGRELDRRWRAVQAYLQRLLSSQGVEPWVAAEIAYLPGLEEVAGLLRLRELTMDYEVVVVDCPPTGSTLRYLNLPEAVGWYMRRIFPHERRLMQWLGPVAERVSGLPMPRDPVFADLERFFVELVEVGGLLGDPTHAAAQVVTTGERVVRRETDRVLGYLQLHEVAVARVVVNRCASEEVVTELADRYRPVPVVPVPAVAGEPTGLEALASLAEALHPEGWQPPTGVATAPPRLVEAEGEFQLRLRLGVREGLEGMRLGLRGEDLVVDWGPVRRHLPLPPPLVERPLLGARLEGEELVIRFGAREVVA